MIFLSDYFSSFSPTSYTTVEFDKSGYFSVQPNNVWINPGEFLGFYGTGIGYRFVMNLIVFVHSILI